MSRSVVIFYTLLIVSVIGGLGYYFYDSHRGELPYYRGDTITNNKSEAKLVSSFQFNNYNGHSSLDWYNQNKILVINCFFTRCQNICPKMATNFYEIQETFKNEDWVKLISLTCDPKYDTSEQLATYSKKYNVDENKWLMATGDKKVLYKFLRSELNIGASKVNMEETDFIHSPFCVLVDNQHHIRGYYDATSKASINQLILDIRKLLRSR